MSDAHVPRKFSESEAPTPVEGQTKLSLSKAIEICRETAKKTEEAATALVARVSSNPPPLH